MTLLDLFQTQDHDKYPYTYHIKNGDIFDEIKNIDSECIQLIITSPPYNLGKHYEKKIDLENYLQSQKKVLQELIRVLHHNGSLCWQVGNFVHKGEVFPLDIYFYEIIKSLGLKLRNRIVWHFNHGLHASKRLSGRYETILWFTKSDDYIFNLDPIRVPSKYPGKRNYKGTKKGELSGNPLGKNPSDFWEFDYIQEEFDCGIIDIPNVKANHPEKTDHPCQFPIELVERCILAFTNENDWVLDPFLGSGTTAIAALKRDRNVIGIDKERSYCKLAQKRVETLLRGELKMRSIGTPIHRPKPTDKVAQIPKEWQL